MRRGQISLLIARCPPTTKKTVGTFDTSTNASIELLLAFEEQRLKEAWLVLWRKGHFQVVSRCER